MSNMICCKISSSNKNQKNSKFFCSEMRTTINFKVSLSANFWAPSSRFLQVVVMSILILISNSHSMQLILWYNFFSSKSKTCNFWWRRPDLVACCSIPSPNFFSFFFQHNIQSIRNNSPQTILYIRYFLEQD